MFIYFSYFINQDNSLDTEIAKTVGNSKYVSQNISEAKLKAVTSKLSEIHEEWKKSEEPVWTITKSVFFASTVVTTIGKHHYYIF